MALKQNIVLLAFLLATFAVTLAQVSQGGGQVSQGGPHENQGRAKRQADQGAGANSLPPWASGNSNWTTCDVTTTPVISCHDCTTRLICKPVGGKLIPCTGPSKPYCNNGICSPIPSAGCA